MCIRDRHYVPCSMSSSIPFGKVHDDDDVDDNVVSLVGGNGDGVVFIMVVATSGIDVVLDDSLLLLFCSCSCDDDDMLFRFVFIFIFIFLIDEIKQGSFQKEARERKRKVKENNKEMKIRSFL